MAGMTTTTNHTNVPVRQPADREIETAHSPHSLPSPAHSTKIDPRWNETVSTGTDGRVIPFPITDKFASKPNSVTHEKSVTNKNRLKATISGEKGREVWTVRIGDEATRKGIRRAVFHIRKETG